MERKGKGEKGKSQKGTRPLPAYFCALHTPSHQSKLDWPLPLNPRSLSRRYYCWGHGSEKGRNGARYRTSHHSKGVWGTRSLKRGIHACTIGIRLNSVRLISRSMPRTSQSAGRNGKLIYYWRILFCCVIQYQPLSVSRSRIAVGIHLLLFHFCLFFLCISQENYFAFKSRKTRNTEISIANIVGVSFHRLTGKV